MLYDCVGLKEKERGEMVVGVSSKDLHVQFRVYCLNNAQLKRRTVAEGKSWTKRL